jgi:hypothetical protein
MRFKNNIIDIKVNDAVKIANGLLMAGSSMIEELSKKDDFKYNSGHGIQVVMNLIRLRNPVDIYSYKSLNPFTKSIGHFDGEAIWINSRKLPSMTVKNIVGLLLHEYAHYCGFKHGNNFITEEKCKYSVPYFLSENVEKWL